MTRFPPADTPRADAPDDIEPAAPPALTARAQAEKAARAAREAEALRANLRRRKAQQRARDTEGPPK